MAIPGYVEIDRWLGHADTALDPAAMRYRARPAAEDAGDCAGCCFRGQSSKVCKAASALATRAGMQDCDERDTVTGRTFVYYLIAIDGRQLMVEGAQHAAPTP